MTVKGQAIPAYDPRGMKGMGLGYATSNRGACHLRGYTPASEVLGVGPLKTDPLAWEGKGALLKLLQDLHAVVRLLRPLQVLRLRRGRGALRRPVLAPWSGIPIDRGRAARRSASASTTWSATTTTWPASARARTRCRSAS